MKFSKFLSIFMLSLVVSPSLSKSLEYLSDDNLFPELVSFAPTELKGIDVSSYQGKINWKEVSEAGIKFVIARSTVRGGEMDSQFENNYKGAKKYGIPFAAYHFSYFLTEEQARKDAKNLITKLKGRKMPIYLDLEWEQQTGLGKRKVTDIAIAFVKTMQAAGYETHIYSNTNWYLNYFYPNEFKALGCKFWLAAYGRDTGYPDTRYKPNKGEYIWQYTSKGRVNGINEPVDMDIMYGTPSTKPDPEPEPKPEPEPVPTPSSVEKMVKIVASVGVNRRSTPSTDTKSNIVGGYSKGTIVQVYGSTKDKKWYVDKDGYYFTANTEWVVDLTGVVNCSYLNVRKTNNTKTGQIIDTIPNGTKLWILKKADGWYYIRLGNGTRGWVYGEYVTLQ